LVKKRERAGADFAVIFDMDGVIVDSNPVHVVALRQYFTTIGLNLPESELEKRVFGRANKDWIADLFGDSLKPKEIQFHSQAKEKLYREMFAPDIHPLKGSVPFLQSLKANHIPAAVASSAISENVEWVLQQTRTREYFDFYLSETNIQRGKPDPEIYLKAAERLHLSPAHCIIIEDSFSGVQAAKSAGCKVVAVTTTHRPDEFKNVDLVIADFRELSIESLISLF